MIEEDVYTFAEDEEGFKSKIELGLRFCDSIKMSLNVENICIKYYTVISEVKGIDYPTICYLIHSTIWIHAFYVYVLEVNSSYSHLLNQ